jgi:hypothetical protein
VDNPRWLFLARATVSLIVLLTSVYIVLCHHYNDTLIAWACGLIGLIIGYWLR